MKHKRPQSPCITWDVTTVTEDYQVGRQKKERQVFVKTTRPAPSITWETTVVIEDYQIPQ